MSETKKRWNESTGEREENPAVDAFLLEIDEVCKKHGFSISHEDGQGGFIVDQYNEQDRAWLWEAAYQPPINIDWDAKE